MMLSTEMEALLKEQEGLRLQKYFCTAGVLTIGYGHNLEKGINKATADFIFQEDVKEVVEPLTKLSWFNKLSQVRQEVIINMTFNLGLPRLLLFKKFIKALEEENFDLASKEMLNSKWASQVGFRSQHLSIIMKHGKFISLKEIKNGNTNY